MHQFALKQRGTSFSCDQEAILNSLNTKERIEKLRLLTGENSQAFNSVRENLPCSGLIGGIPRATLIEVSGAPGAGKTEWVLNFLRQNPSLRAAWVEEKMSIYPRSFKQRGVDLDRVLFVESHQETLWTVTQLIRSSLFPIVIVQSNLEQTIPLRRLQLLVKRSRGNIILLKDRPVREGGWPISIQVQVQRKCRFESFEEVIQGRDSFFRTEVLKDKRGKSWKAI